MALIFVKLNIDSDERQLGGSLEISFFWHVSLHWTAKTQKTVTRAEGLEKIGFTASLRIRLRLFFLRFLLWQNH